MTCARRASYMYNASSLVGSIHTQKRKGTNELPKHNSLKMTCLQGPNKIIINNCT